MSALAFNVCPLPLCFSLNYVILYSAPNSVVGATSLGLSFIGHITSVFFNLQIVVQSTSLSLFTLCLIMKIFPLMDFPIV